MLSLWPDLRREFATLSDREILSLAIAAEEEDGRLYSELAARLGDAFPQCVALFEGMAAAEDEQRRRLLDLYVNRFGRRLVPIRREHVRGFLPRKSIWLMQDFGLDRAKQEVLKLEESASRFYLAAATQATEASVQKLFCDLAAEEKAHAMWAKQLGDTVGSADAKRRQRWLLNVAALGGALVFAAGILIGLL
ncbi:ferritin-like domain-containing protein [Devosia aurantiaca]|uniref:Ferritin family protein n=1 Tax=Devosia aurantiaca TaxID=2714858 RepID=A0A6M1SRC7_9HYPH|nr:ferritin family protein [Devosia aurantiaca]NGP16943.1 ferritin family protein [Devosia aurantiaca]